MLVTRDEFHHIQHGSQYGTCPVFEWCNEGWLWNGPVSKWHLKIGTFRPVFELKLLKDGSHIVFLADTIMSGIKYLVDNNSIM